MHPETALISHRFSAHNAIQIYGGVVVLVPDMDFEIVSVNELSKAIGAIDVGPGIRGINQCI